MADGNIHAKAEHPGQRQTYIEHKQYFPQGSIQALCDKLKVVHGDNAPAQTTVEAVLWGKRLDRYGIMELFMGMVTATREKMRQAMAELEDAN